MTVAVTILIIITVAIMLYIARYYYYSRRINSVYKLISDTMHDAIYKEKYFDNDPVLKRRALYYHEKGNKLFNYYPKNVSK